MTKEIPRIITPSELKRRLRREKENLMHVATVDAILVINKEGVYPGMHISLPKHPARVGFSYSLPDEEMAEEVSSDLTLRCKNAGWDLQGCTFRPIRQFDEELALQHYDLELR